MNITEYTVEEIKDPTGILSGKRYEFVFHVEMPEEDELYNEHGLQLKVLYLVDEKQRKILNYHFYDSLENNFLEFAMEEEEEKLINEFCAAHYQEADE